MGLALQNNNVSDMRETVVIGLGETGLSVAKHLSNQNISFTMLDTRENPPQLLYFKKNFPNAGLYLGELDAEMLSQAEQVIVSPGIDLNQVAIRKVVNEYDCECVGDIELFARSAKKPWVHLLWICSSMMMLNYLCWNYQVFNLNQRNH